MGHKKLKKLWDTFDRGDHLDTADLRKLAKSAEAGEEYLAARGDYLALFKTRFDLARINEYLTERARV